MIRVYRYPLRPTARQRVVLTTWLASCCDLYNAALQERRGAWKIAHKFITRIEQTMALTEVRAADAAVAAIPVEAQRSAICRVDRAFKAFFRRCKTGETPGYPRFRSRKRYNSFSFPFVRADEKRMHIPKLGLVRFHRYRPLEGVPREVTVGREPSGEWYVSVSCDIGAAPEKISVRSAVGIDLGLTNFATLSDGVEVPNPRFFRAAEKRLKRQQQTYERRQRGSKSRERQHILVVKSYRHVSNQRKDFTRKLACTLFERYDLIAHEDLVISRMVRGNFTKSVSDVGWGLFLRALRDKAERTGRHVIAVDPRGTSQRCSGCGGTVRKELSDRQHICACGTILGRDHNAALNILALGGSVVEAEKFSAVETEGSL